MLKIKITKKGKPLKQVMLDSSKMLEADKEQVRNLGQLTLTEMHSQIDSAIKHPDKSTGKLKNSVNLEFFGDGVSWGIGRISELVTHWAAFNWGGHWTINAKKGKYLKFKNKEGNFVYKESVEHNHPATNFLEKTIHFLDSIISTFKPRKI